MLKSKPYAAREIYDKELAIREHVRVRLGWIMCCLFIDCGVNDIHIYLIYVMKCDEMCRGINPWQSHMIAIYSSMCDDGC